MKLAEALILRSDYKKRMEQLKKRLANCAKVQEGEKPAENPEDLLQELDDIMTHLTELIQKINKTNCTIIFDGEKTLADVLAEREQIWDKRIILTHLVEAAGIKQDRYSQSEVKFFSTINIAEKQKQIDQLSKEFRELDTKIQCMNWNVDLV